ncbi:TorF family putative porin [Polymorphobacter arshaanensis]|nr:TorF family putative porin [Polymorphobacter arshaanensis]
MIRSIRFAALAATALVSLGASGAAYAEDAPAEATPFVTFTGNVTLVSDYRWRGVSLSNTDAAIQGGITATTKPGFFVSMWGSSIAPYGGATTEVDLYGGWTGTFSGITPTIGIYGYLYPGGTNVDFYELYGSLGFALGPVGFTTGINFAPNQNNIGGGNNTYIYIAPSFTIPGVPITLKGNLGYESGDIVAALGTPYDNKVDYMIGADFKYKMLTFGMQWVGNNRSSYGGNLGDTFLVSLGASF